MNQKNWKRLLKRGLAIGLAMVTMCSGLNLTAGDVYATDDIHVVEMTEADTTESESAGSETTADVVAGDQITEENTESDTAEMENRLQVEGTNSFGNLLNNEINDKLEEQEASEGYNIYDLEVTGQTVTVKLDTVEESQLVVGIYDDAGVKMLASGNTTVAAGTKEATVTIDTDSMPQYFDVRAYLVEPETLAPLCTVFECPNYTQEMQEFFAKTVDDFEGKEVLNLDADKSNNFGVFADDVLYIEKQDGVNQVISEDAVNETYVIGNASTEITGLQAGNIFALEYDANRLLIVKVASVSMEGTTATVIGQADTAMEEVFQYLKLDNTGNTDDVQLDDSTLPAGITRETVESEAQELQPDMVEGSKSWGKTINYNLKDYKAEGSYGGLEGSAELSGTIEFNITFDLEYYITFHKQYLSIAMDYSAAAKVTGEIEGTIRIPLAKLIYEPIVGVSVIVTPAIKADVTISGSFSASLSGTIGVAYERGSGVKNLTSAPSLSASFDVEGSLFIGISLTPEINILGTVVEADVEGEAGAKMTLARSRSTSDGDDVLHACKVCLEGDVSAVIGVTFEAEFLDKWSYEWSHEKAWKISDCHWSVTYREFAFAPCDHKVYKVDVTVKDIAKKPMKDVVISGNIYTGKNGSLTHTSEVKTDSQGKAVIYLPAGKQKIKISSPGYANVWKQLNVGDPEVGEYTAKECRVTLKEGVAIDEEAFPDTVFRFYVAKNYDTDKNGVLSLAEASKVTSIDARYISYKRYGQEIKIKDLSGIEYFPQLTRINCTNVKIDQLDVSKCPALTMLNCHGCEMKVLKVKGCETLITIKCRDNLLTSLDVSDLSKLKSLDCKNNELSQLTLDGCESLLNIYCSENLLEKLDLSSCAQISGVDCDTNKLADMNISGCSQLYSLDCHDNNLSYLDLGNYTKLDDLNCSDNQLGTLIVSGCSALTSLSCVNNQLTSLDVSSCPELFNINCSYNQLKVLDLSQNTKLGIVTFSAGNPGIQVIGWPRSSGTQTTGSDMDGTTVEESETGVVDETDVTDKTDETAMTEPVEAASDTLVSPMTYTGLVPNAIYNFYIMQVPDDGISSDNLLYITQMQADENGSLSVPFEYEAEVLSSEAVLVCAQKTDISAAEITIEDMEYTGEEQVAEPKVVLNGVTLVEDEDYELAGDYVATEIGSYVVRIQGIGNYTGSVEREYRIKKVLVTALTLNQTVISLEKGKSFQLNATVTPASATDPSVSWKSSNNTVAAVDGTGKVTAQSAGSATITCTAKDGSGIKATCKVTVTDSSVPVNPTVKVTKITLNKTTASVTKGKTLQLTATVTPASATNKAVAWKSSNTKIATVSSTGKVTAKSAGTVTITCTAKDGSGKKATCKITVTNPVVKVTKITLNKKTATLSPKETLTLKATITPTNAANKAVTWKSSNTKIATVNSRGKVTAKSAGTVTITCTAKDGSGKKATCKITVYNNTQAYVARIYTKALGRTAEPGGLNYWTNEIRTGKRTPVQVAEEFFFAPEFTNKKLNNTEYVKVLYRTFMGREYDKGGLDYWVARLNKGESRKSVLESFAGCEEFKKIVKGFGL